MRTLTLVATLFGASAIADLVHTDFPHLLIPLKQSLPDTHFGTQYDPTLSYSNATGLAEHVEISFDVPDNEAAICRLNFLINTHSKKNAPRALNGTAPYSFSISRLQSTINSETDTWNSHPQVTEYLATYLLGQAGNVSTTYSKWFECPKGQLAQFLLYPDGERDFGYYWFELDYPQEDGGPHGVVLEMHT